MKRKSSIIKLSLIGVAIVLGFIFAFVPFSIGFKDYSGYAKNIKLGLDLKGGVYAVYEAQDNNSGKDFGSAMESTITSLEQILAAKGYTESTVQKEGVNKIRVSVPNVQNPEDILRILGNPAEIKFKLDSTGEEVLTGRHITSAVSTTNGADYVVALSLTSEGAARFAKATGENIGSSMSIYRIVGGEEQLISSPRIESAIAGGQAIITGMGSREAADQLAQEITAGMFSLTLSQKEVSTVAASLGENALKLGLIAGIIGIALIIAFIIYLYRLFGVASSMALLAYTVLMLFILAVFPWVQLTLPGIAGILLSIGMAIDGNIIISERIKDEYRGGKSILSSFHYGFRRSRSAIVDGNVTTIIASVVLLFLGTGAVKGFAVTLLIGLALNMVSALLITPLLMRYFVRINDYNPNLFNLHRGEGFEDLSANQNDALAELELQQEQQKKEARRQHSLEGGNA